MKYLTTNGFEQIMGVRKTLSPEICYVRTIGKKACDNPMQAETAPEIPFTVPTPYPWQWLFAPS